MKKTRVTSKEKGLIKGSLRRVFSRSELRRRALDAAQLLEFSDPSRKRVTRWGRCNVCSNNEPLYKMVVDHIEPVIPVDSSLEAITYDELVDRLWCDERNLQAICSNCHSKKSKEENKERRRLKKEGTKK